MKYLIKENQFENISNLFKNSFERIKDNQKEYEKNEDAYWKTLNRYKLPIGIVSKVVKPFNGEYYKPWELQEIFYYYLQANGLPTNYEDDSFKIDIYLDDFARCDATLKKTNEHCSGYADLFYNKKNTITLGFDFYLRGDWRDPDENYMEIDSINEYETMEFPFKVTDLNDFFDWYHKNYFKIIINFLKKYLKKVREVHPL